MNRGISGLCMDALSMKKILMAIGGDKRPFENTTTYLHRISETVGLHFSVVRAVWNGERLSAETARKLKKAVKQHEQFTREYAERLAWRAELLRESDEEFFREEIDWLRHLADRLRNLDTGKE